VQPKVTDRVKKHVVAKLKAMCRFSTQAKVAEKLGVVQQTVSAILRGAANPSAKIATLILGEPVEDHPSNARRPRSDKLRNAKTLLVRDGTNRRLRDQPVSERHGRDVPDIQGSRCGNDVVRLESAQEQVNTLPKSKLREIESQNTARIQLGLHVLKVKVYSCFSCLQKFESTGSRCCANCRGFDAPRLSGQDVY